MSKLKTIFSRVVGFKNWFLKASLIKKAVVVIVIGGILFFATSPLRSSNKPLYTTAPVTRNTISDIVSESGNVEARGQVDVYSTSTGVIENLYIEDGKEVKAGQQLFTVQSSATPEEKAVAYSTYQSATSAYNQALNAYRDKQATAQKVGDDVKGHDFDETFTQKATRTTAEAARDSAYDATISTQAALKSAELSYKATQNVLVVAPANGTVGNLSNVVGDKVSAKTVVSATPVLVLGDIQKLSIIIEINEVDRPKLKLDQKASVKITATPDKAFEAKIASIDNYGTNTNGVITYKVSLEIEGLDSGVRPRMTANVEIETQRSVNVLTVPNSAIKAYQGKKAVQVLDKNNQPEFIPVKVGLKGTTSTEIIEGVGEGTQVIISSPKTPTGRGLFGG